MKKNILFAGLILSLSICCFYFYNKLQRLEADCIFKVHVERVIVMTNPLRDKQLDFYSNYNRKWVVSSIKEVEIGGGVKKVEEILGKDVSSFYSRSKKSSDDFEMLQSGQIK